MLPHTTNLYKFIVKYPVIYYAFRSWKNVFVPFLCSVFQIDECVELCQKEKDFAQMNLRSKIENVLPAYSSQTMFQVFENRT